jgi:predicted ATPase
LTPVRDPDSVLPAIAETLGVREIPDGSTVTEVLAHFLRNKQMLLVLDNFEHVLTAAAPLSQLTETAPRVKFLATSRASLRLRGERELRIETLPVPSLADAEDLDRFSSFASVTLFTQRVQSFRAEFMVAPDNARTIAKILYRIDGLPLAIELAAARLRLLSPKQLLSRLNKRFDILTGGLRDLPERQQTLRSAIDWSYNLLTEAQKRLFCRIAVFSGGWNIDEVEAVCNLNGDLGSSALQALEALVDCSLVSASDGIDGLPRFGMLQSLRDYAYERLWESGESEEVSRVHAEYFLRFAEDVEPRVRTADRLRWQKILHQDLENIRRALAWASADSSRLELGARITVALAHYWAICGQRTEGLQWCQRFAAMLDANTAVEIRAALLGVAGGISLVSGKTESVVPSMLESLECARQSEQKQLLANCLLWTGAWALTLKSLSLAWGYLQESLALFRELGDEWSEVEALNWLGYVAFQRGDKYLADVLSGQSLVVARRQGDPWSLVFPLLTIAQRALAVGDMPRAESSLLEVESVLRTVGNNWDLAWVLNGLGQVHLARKETASAKAYFTEAIRLARECGNKVVMVLSLLEAAILITLRLEDRPDQDIHWRKLELDTAARLCGVTTPMVDDPTVLRRTGAQDVYEFMLVRVQSAMEPDEWDCGFAEGARMSLDKALDAAASELSPS